MPSLTDQQQQVIHSPLAGSLFLEGLAGSGKTTAAVERMLYLMQAGVPAQQILLLTPQRTLAQPYREALATPGVMAGGAVSILTLGGLARRSLEIFFPLIAEEAGFAHPDKAPAFLTLETAQYFMAQVVQPLLEKGYFASLSIDRNRLYSQILDNLNKAAVVGFPHTEIADRLKSAWSGSQGQLRVYEDAQECANLFRQFCLEHNLLDYSLQIELFIRFLWPNDLCRLSLQRQYRHLITDNLEEDVPAAHDLIRQWLPELDSALLVYDQEGGYRTFLGADPVSAYTLKNHCTQSVLFTHNFNHTAALHTLSLTLRWALGKNPPPPAEQRQSASASLLPITQRFFPQMLDEVAVRIARLVQEDGFSPAQIVVLAPYLSDSLRFSLLNRLENLSIPCRSHRPSRALRDEPIIQCMLTLAYFAHPAWLQKDSLNKFDLAYALIQALDGLDLVRAQLLAQTVFRTREHIPYLSSFELIQPKFQERITYRVGEAYETLRRWLEDYQSGEPQELEVFFVRIFEEVLSRPGFGFYRNENAGERVANLIESARKFRQAMSDFADLLPHERGRLYLKLVREGVIAAQYLRSWQTEETEAVLLAPAYTFLISNRPVEVQFWLDVGSSGWYERLFQPLTQPYVLSRNWREGALWNSDWEGEIAEQNLERITLGLIRRCRSLVCFGYSELGESGFEQRGLLLRLLQHTLEELNREERHD